MSNAATVTEFGTEQFIRNAKEYAKDKRIVDAASKYDNLDDAIAALTRTWNALDQQRQDGGGFTPPTELGFGSDNGSQIAAALMGLKTSVGATRKAFAAIGKN